MVFLLLLALVMGLIFVRFAEVLDSYFRAFLFPKASFGFGKIVDPLVFFFFFDLVTLLLLGIARTDFFNSWLQRIKSGQV